MTPRSRHILGGFDGVGTAHGVEKFLGGLLRGAQTETTLKRFYLEGEKVRLQPANAEMEPIVVPAESVRIQGRLLAVHRR